MLSTHQIPSSRDRRRVPRSCLLHLFVLELLLFLLDFSQAGLVSSSFFLNLLFLSNPIELLESVCVLSVSFVVLEGCVLEVLQIVDAFGVFDKPGQFLDADDLASKRVEYANQKGNTVVCHSESVVQDVGQADAVYKAKAIFVHRSKHISQVQARIRQSSSDLIQVQLSLVYQGLLVRIGSLVQVQLLDVGDHAIQKRGVIENLLIGLCEEMEPRSSLFFSGIFRTKAFKEFRDIGPVYEALLVDGVWRKGFGAVVAHHGKMI